MKPSELPKAFILLAVILLAAAPVLDIIPQSWHDQQRLTQIILIFLASLLLTVIGLKSGKPDHIVGHSTRRLLGSILVLGIASSSLAHQPLWAFTELSLFIGCIALMLASLRLREQVGLYFDKALFGALGFVIVAMSVKFCAGYIAALVSHTPVVPDVLLDGFSNLRFLGQFQTITLPLLALPWLLTTASRRQKTLAMTALVVWWFAALASGTRATWLGMAVAMMLLAWLGPGARRWIQTQAIAIVMALLVYITLLILIPQALGNPEFGASDHRLTTSLSGRGEIWLYALEMIKAQPWLGAGPMHFAELTLFSVAHPHQAVLQWAAEWGLPSLLLLTVLLARPALALLRYSYQERYSDDYTHALRLCLLASLTGAGVQSMVDGVIVMPYTQTWLAIVAGWIWALEPDTRKPQEQNAGASRQIQIMGLAAMLIAACWLSHVAIRDYKTIEASNIPGAPPRPGKGADGPRFWLLGSIANPDMSKKAWER